MPSSEVGRMTSMYYLLLVTCAYRGSSSSGPVASIHRIAAKRSSRKLGGLEGMSEGRGCEAPALADKTSSYFGQKSASNSSRVSPNVLKAGLGLSFEKGSPPETEKTGLAKLRSEKSDMPGGFCSFATSDAEALAHSELDRG